MQFNKNAVVRNTKGDKIGHVDRIVIDPSSKKVTHLVANKGLLFKQDKLIPLEMVHEAKEDKVVLSGDVDNLDTLPDFEEEHHVPAAPAERGAGGHQAPARPFYWYSAIPTRIWWGMHANLTHYPNFAKPNYVTKTERNIPDGMVPLEEGAKVFSADDDHIGNIEKIYTDSEENRAIYLLLAKGVLFKTAKLIPTVWIKEIREESVILSVETAEIEALPEFKYQGG